MIPGAFLPVRQLRRRARRYLPGRRGTGLFPQPWPSPPSKPRRDGHG
jgi:hypothetical protein